MPCKKIAYRTQSQAKQTLRRMQREVRRGPLPIRIYWCPEHQGFHITSKPKRSSG